MRSFVAALLLVWGGGLCAGEVAVAPDGRVELPSANAAVEVRVADAAPVAVAAEKRMLPKPGQLVPAAEWRTATGVVVRLDLCLLSQPIGLSDVTFLVARLRLTNPTAQLQTTALALALLPVGELRDLLFERHAFSIEGRPVLVADQPSRGALLADSPFAKRPLAPRDTGQVTSAKGECRGEMIFDFALAPGQTQTLGWLCPLDGAPTLEACRALVIEDLFARAEKEANAAR